MASTSATVGILSIGDMGAGISQVLSAHGFRVVTNITGRSQATHDRVRAANVQALSSDEDLVAQSHFVLSIVPPRDAYATAQRIVAALESATRPADAGPLYFLDLNAIAPSSARAIGSLFKGHEERLRYIDGGIIGGPPALDHNSGQWTCPSVVLSGPEPLSGAPGGGAALFAALNGKDVGKDIGIASGLKCCFASLTKGFTSLAIQSYSTAAQLGVLPELQEHLAQFFPQLQMQAERGITAMPPKAYRWVDEMKEIGKTFREDGGWREGWGDGLYDSIAGVYKFVADGTDLGAERTENRKRKTVDDVVDALSGGLREQKKQRQ